MELKGISLDRLHDRKALLASFDSMRRDIDASGLMRGVDVFHEQALNVLTSPKLLHALDLSREDPRLVERYGKGENRNRDDGGPRLTSHFLAARRLVEAGARVVTLAFSRWDYHSNNFGQLREDLPLLDAGLTALITDLHERGMDQDVSVICWGEFGRTPYAQDNGTGRDHNPGGFTVWLAGGGVKPGLTYGATDEFGHAAIENRVHMHDLHATLLHLMGVDHTKIT
jgi:hypothetical protein